MFVSESKIRDIQIFIGEVYSLKTGPDYLPEIGRALARVVRSDRSEFVPSEASVTYEDRYCCALPVLAENRFMGYLVMSRLAGLRPPYSDEEVELLNFLFSFVPLVYHGLPSGRHGGKFSVFFRRYGLTAKEAEVAGLLHRGSSNREIAEKLGISEGTVKNHVYNVFNKTGADSRTRFLYLAAAAVREDSGGAE